MIDSRTFSDLQLFALLQQKDKNALAFLYDRYAPALYGALLKKAHNEDKAKDILQKSFIKIWYECSSPGCLRQNVFLWMYSIVVKTANEELATFMHQPAGVIDLVA